jgi:hypothetical protein
MDERMQGQGRWLQRSSLNRAGGCAGGTCATVSAAAAAAAAIYAAATLLTTRPAISGAGAAPAVHSPGASTKDEPPPRLPSRRHVHAHEREHDMLACVHMLAPPALTPDMHMRTLTPLRSPPPRPGR